MDEIDTRREWIRSLWQTETESGVVVYLVRAAVQAMTNRGFPMREAEQLLLAAEKLYAKADFNKLLTIIARINREIHAALTRGDRGETSFAEYLARLQQPVETLEGEPRPSAYLDKVKGAWVGKCIGVALGDPLEGWTAEMIQDCYGQVSDYVSQPRLANDDTAYQVLVLHTLDEHGPSFTSEHLALEWVEHIPHAFTAEWVALENVKAGLMPPESGWFRNACAEWVGAQMRCEVHGLLHPLRPRDAAESAFRDAIISHRGEGVCGCIFGAVLISMAFSGKPIEEIIGSALTWTPPTSRLRQVVESTIRLCKALGDRVAVLRELRGDLDPYHWIHTLPNAAAVTAGLCLGKGDFEQSVLTTLHCGFDTDCSTGQTAAVLGALTGWDGIPARWKQPIGHEFKSYVIDFERMNFDALTQWTVDWGTRLLGRSAADSGPDSPG